MGVHLALALPVAVGRSVTGTFRPATREDFVPGRVVYWISTEWRSIDAAGAMTFSPASVHAELVHAISPTGLSFRVQKWDDRTCTWGAGVSRWLRFRGWWGSRYVVWVEGS